MDYSDDFFVLLAVQGDLGVVDEHERGFLNKGL